MKILFSLQLLIRRLAQEVIDEPLAQHGGDRKEEEQADNISLKQHGTSPSYILRRLARDGAAEAKVRKLSTLKKGDNPVVANLPQRETQGKARDQAASVVGVSGKMVGDAN